MDQVYLARYTYNVPYNMDQVYMGSMHAPSASEAHQSHWNYMYK